jgi:hypothetical protein
MREKLEKKVRSMLTETTLDMKKYETRWFDIVYELDYGVAFFKHKNGHSVEARFSFDNEGDITDLRIDLEY